MSIRPILSLCIAGGISASDFSNGEPILAAGVTLHNLWFQTHAMSLSQSPQEPSAQNELMSALSAYVTATTFLESLPWAVLMLYLGFTSAESTPISQSLAVIGNGAFIERLSARGAASSMERVRTTSVKPNQASSI